MDGRRERKGGACRLVAGVVTLTLTLGLARAETIEPLVVNARLKRSADSAAVAQVIHGAARRLGDPRCQTLLSDFNDVAGKPLVEALDAEGLTAPEFLGRLFFYEGSEGHCRARTLAYTTPGSRVVFVCSARFRRASETNGAQVEAAIIHEALHALGLGENPPTWEEITARVLDRCRR